MKVSQLRKLLDKAASQHDALGRNDVGDALRKLAGALKPADRLQADRLIESLKR